VLGSGQGTKTGIMLCNLNWSSLFLASADVTMFVNPVGYQDVPYF
jgi:hypothetical protein